MSPATNVGIALDSASFYFNVFGGIFVFICGIIGNSLNIVVFLSLKTFRKSPCAFCLIVLAISDNCMLLLNVIPTILNGIFDNYTGINVIFACKISASFGQTFALISQYIMCLAAIDQYFSTAMNERYKGLSAHFKRRLLLICVFICILHGIPFLIYYNAETLPGTNTTICHLTDTNGLFSKYLIYIAIPILGIFLPISIMCICGLVALHNVRNMRKRRVHMIRLRLEQQLTAMVLIKILCVCLTIVPFLATYIIRYFISNHTKNPLVEKQLLLFGRVFVFLWFINYADSFYIFIGSSARFRRQLKFVLFDIYLKEWRRNRIQPINESFDLSITSSHLVEFTKCQLNDESISRRGVVLSTSWPHQTRTSTYLRPLDRNETACLQKGYKPIRLVYTEQPLTARILVDGSKTLPIDDLIREFFSLHRMLLSKTRLDDIDICLMPHCDIREITVNQLTKLNGHQEPVLLLTARSNSEYLITRDLEELTFRQQTGLNVDISVLNSTKQDNERLRTENHQQQERINELEKQISEFLTIRDEMKQLCKEYRRDMKKNLEKNDEYYRKFDRLDDKLTEQFLNEQNLLIPSRLKSE